MSDNVWFVGCVQHEGDFEVFGPFFSEEDAALEAKGGCQNAHPIGRTVGDRVTVRFPIQVFSHRYMAPEEIARITDWHVARSGRDFEVVG